jgi:hypothetical protein
MADVDLVSNIQGGQWPPPCKQYVSELLHWHPLHLPPQWRNLQLADRHKLVKVKTRNVIQN